MFRYAAPKISAAGAPEYGKRNIGSPPDGGSRRGRNVGGQNEEKVGLVVHNADQSAEMMRPPMEIEQNIEHRKKNSEILVVEDSLTQAKRLERLLKENGYSVCLARNGMEGLDQARRARPAVIITDVMMPEMDGYEMCRQIKADPDLRQIPVVLLTSLSDPRDVIQGLQCGADNFLTKPYEDAYLLRRLYHILANEELRRAGHAQMSVEVYFAGQFHKLTADRIQIIDLLLSTFEAAVLQSNQLMKLGGDYRNALDEIKRTQANFQTLMETTGDAVVVVGENGLVRYANPAAEVLFDRAAEAMTGKPVFFPLEGEGTREITFPSSQGQDWVGDMRVVRSNWDGDMVLLATIRDITETVRLRERLESEAVSDALTGLFNRRGFFKIVPGRLRLAERMGFSVACLFADLDGFKQVNDVLGHDEGDQVLREAAEVLRKTFRDCDILARIGGDEFAVLMVQEHGEGADVEAVVRAVKERLARNLELWNERTNRSYRLAMSVGVAVARTAEGLSLDALLSEADQKMYAEKLAKRKTCG